MRYDNPIVGFQHVENRGLGVVPIFADGFKPTRFSPFIQSYMNQDFLADGCEVAVFEIVYDKSDLRLYGVRLFDRD